MHVSSCARYQPTGSCPSCIESRRTFSFSASRRQTRCEEACLTLHLSFPSSLFPARRARSEPHDAPFVPSLGLSCWNCLHADPTQARAITTPHGDACVRSSDPPDLPISALYLAVTPSEASAEGHAGTRNSWLSSVLSYLAVANGRSPEVTLRFDVVGGACGQMLDVNTQNGFACVVWARARLLCAHPPTFLLSRSRMDFFVPHKSV